VRDATSGEVLVELDAPTEGAVLNVEWSPDGSRIAFGDTEGVLAIADAGTGERTSIGLGHTSGIVGIAWSPDGSVVATGSNDGTARIWDATTDLLPEVQRFGARDLSNGIPGIGFTADGNRLVVADWLVTATKIYDLRPEAGSELGAFAAAPGSFSLAFMPSGDVMTTTDRFSVTVHDATTGAVERTHSVDSTVSGFAASADGRFAALATEEGFPVTVLDLDSDEVIGEFSAPGWLESAAWSPTGEHLSVVYGSDDGGTVSIIDRTGTELGRIEQPGSNITGTAFDATGTLLAVAKNGRTRFDPEQDRLEIWDWARGDIVDRLDVVGMLVRSDPSNNTWIASVFNDADLGVWDATTGERLVDLVGHTGLIRDIATSGDGRRVATASNDRTVRIWDAETGTQLQAVPLDRGVVSVALDAAGSRLATLGEDGIVRIWALDVDELTAIATTRVTRSFDDQECRQYLHLERCEET
jgi:WD40 repeat protein